MEQSPAWEVNR